MLILISNVKRSSLVMILNSIKCNTIVTCYLCVSVISETKLRPTIFGEAMHLFLILLVRQVKKNITECNL